MYRETVILIFFVCVSKLLLWWHFYFVSVVLNLYKMLIMYIEGHLWGYTDYGFLQDKITNTLSFMYQRQTSIMFVAALFYTLIILYHDDASFVYIRVYQHIIFAQKILSMPFYRYIHCTHHRHIRYKERVEQRIYLPCSDILYTSFLILGAVLYQYQHVHVHCTRRHTPLTYQQPKKKIVVDKTHIPRSPVVHYT